jgi:hypothetical protein
MKTKIGKSDILPLPKIAENSEAWILLLFLSDMVISGYGYFG